MNIRFILSSCVLLLFILLAGGSYDDIAFMLWVFIAFIVIAAILIIITRNVQEKNKEKRLKLIKWDEANDGEFNRSVSLGDDRCMFYFDSSKKQVMIMRVNTKCVKKIYVNNFEFCGNEYFWKREPYFCIYDEVNRHILCGDYRNIDVKFTNKDISDEDVSKDITPLNSIQAKLIEQSIIYENSTVKYVCTLIDECHGMIVVVRDGRISSIFNYVNGEDILRKTGNKSFISCSVIGNYHFIMDDFFNILVIITPSSYEIFNYSDIIEVSYEENGKQIYSKSAMRTVGGAIVGGALMGGAGAVVGGLSGTTNKNIEVKDMDIKILLRSTQKSTCVLNFNDSRRILKTEEENKLYEKYKKNANNAKDIISVIIDKVKQGVMTSICHGVAQSVKHSNVVDEIAKLAKLKADGFLTEEEFNAQKAKLLNT